MALARDQILKEIDDVLAAASGFSMDSMAGTVETTRLAGVIERYAPQGSIYRAQADRALSMGYDKFKVEPLAEVVRAFREDVDKGYVRSVEELIHGEVFEDFLEMAAELQSKNFHAAAAVIAGSVLEDHLRKLATKENVPVVGSSGRPRGVDALSQELVKAGVFTEPQRKILVGWYGQRTEGAHGRPENVIPEEVGRMIAGVRDFVAGTRPERRLRLLRAMR